MGQIFVKTILIFSVALGLSLFAHAEDEVAADQTVEESEAPTNPTKKQTALNDRLKAKVKHSAIGRRASLIFDIPLTYNKRVSYWLQYYQTRGKSWFTDWLELSTRYMPMIQKELQMAGLPQDLAYMVMIESGFSSHAQSTANAVGPWQFIHSTGSRFGLRVNWWLDERRDFSKSTQAAVRYLRSLYREFGSWYLVAASYNMGETGLRRQVHKFHTKDFWALCRVGALPVETMDYVPKILAAMMIAKTPGIYGFTNLTKLDPIEYEVTYSPGGVNLNDLADVLGVTRKSLKDLNAELILGYVPPQVNQHPIKIPKGALIQTGSYFQKFSKPFAKNQLRAKNDL